MKTDRVKSGLELPTDLGHRSYESIPMRPVTWFRDRISGEAVAERVFGEKELNRLYRTPSGRLLMDSILCRSLTSSIYGWLQRRRSSRLKIPAFIDSLGIDATEAELPIDRYRSLDEFFIRRLKPGTRPIDPCPEHFVSPADGRVLVYSSISEALPLKIKGSQLSVADLLCDWQRAQDYEGGALIVVRLAPADYHRFHFSDDGIAYPSVPVRGRLHAVHPIALTSGAPSFRNKRVITRLETRAWGMLVLIEIGALAVGTIVQTYSPGPVRRGQEKGFFRFGGSTVVVLVPKNKLQFDSDLLAASKEGMESYVRMGTKLGQSIECFVAGAPGPEEAKRHEVL